MSEVDNVINSILGPAATDAPKTRFYRCPQCQHVFEHPAETLPPVACPACQTKTVFRVHPTEAIARAEAAKATEALSTPASVPATHAVNTDAPAPTPAPTTKPRKAAKSAPVEPPAPNPVAQAPATSLVQVSGDPKAERKARIEKFVVEHKLNGVSATPVGYGTVDSIGYTRWVDKDGKRVPVTSFLEVTDTPESFKAEFKAAQKDDSTVKLDAARICGLSDELRAIAYGGEITASLYDSVRGHVRSRIGDEVEIGARMSKHGTVIFQVLGPKAVKK